VATSKALPLAGCISGELTPTGLASGQSLVLLSRLPATRGQIVWTTTGLGSSDLAVFDKFLQTPEELGGSSAVAAQQADRGGVPIIVPADERIETLTGQETAADSMAVPDWLLRSEPDD
jgi:hypothetical protein